MGAPENSELGCAGLWAAVWPHCSLPGLSAAPLSAARDSRCHGSRVPGAPPQASLWLQGPSGQGLGSPK